jgi:hypothetical protein
MGHYFAVPPTLKYFKEGVTFYPSTMFVQPSYGEMDNCLTVEGHKPMIAFTIYLGFQIGMDFLQSTVYVTIMKA